MTTRHVFSRRVSHAIRLGIVAAAALVFSEFGTAPVLHGQGGACAAPANAVVAENCLTGDGNWTLAAGPDPSIQGYASPFSINTGQSVAFKVNTDASDYRIDIYRLGYYGGVGARLVTSLNVSGETPQDACASDVDTGLVDCGNWHTSMSWTSSGAVSGVYVAKLVRTDNPQSGSGANQILFVVRDDTRQSKLLFQTSDTTWQAYNRYGGGSLYCGGPISNAGSEYINTCPTRSAKVSYNRPFDTGDHDPKSWIYNAEYPMIRWVEANGYDVSYVSGIDVDRGGWFLHDTGLIRWLTASDCRALAVELNASADHLEANPSRRQRR